MDLMVEFPGDRVVPRERFGPIPQLFVGAPSEQGAKTLMAHRQVVENLEHINQNSNGHREQHNRLRGADHLEQRD